jgi:prepilin peptidase CpaA
MPPEWMAGLVLAAICAAGIWFDVRERRLPNWLCLLALLTGIGVSFLTGHSSTIGSHLLHFAVALAAGLALFQFGLVGGGDAKFYAGIAAWFPFKAAGSLLLAVSLTGFAALLTWMVWRRMKRIPARRNAETDADKFPYGIAISLGAIWALYSLIN